MLPAFAALTANRRIVGGPLFLSRSVLGRHRCLRRYGCLRWYKALGGLTLGRDEALGRNESLRRHALGRYEALRRHKALGRHCRRSLGLFRTSAHHLDGIIHLFIQLHFLDLGELRILRNHRCLRRHRRLREYGRLRRLGSLENRLSSIVLRFFVIVCSGNIQIQAQVGQIKIVQVNVHQICIRQINSVQIQIIKIHRIGGFFVLGNESIFLLEIKVEFKIIFLSHSIYLLSWCSHGYSITGR
jgi:hypothetical protein